jgi:hypothetical protein
LTTQPPGAGNLDAGIPSAAQERPLKESLGDASVLLWFATREGKEVDDEVLRDIVRAQATLRDGPNPEVEGIFWTAYRKLAKAVQPASIDSILATYSYPFGYHHAATGKRRLTDAARTKKLYSWLSLGILFLLLFVQIFWFIGTTWRTDLENHRAELDGIAGNLRVMMVEVKAAHDLRNDLDPSGAQQITSAKQTPMSFFSEGVDPNRLIEERLQILMNRQDQSLLLYANASLRGDRVQKMLLGNYKMLKSWDFVTDLAELPDGSDTSVGTSRSSSTESSFCVEDNINDFYTTLCERAVALEKQHLGVEDALVNSKTILAVLSQYLLPLLYGLIGSLAYILRTLSSEIHNVTFTRGSEIRYALRWPLGMLGGVTVGLFFDPADFSGFAAITPLGLAFLAGYGVELLFTGLDRMVSAFTGEGAGRPRAT